MAAPIAAARGAPVVVAVGLHVAVARVAAAVVTGIGTVIGIVIITCLRRCRDRERTEQREDTCHDQCQSAAPWRAGGSRTVHCNLQHASVAPQSWQKIRPKCDRLHTQPSRQARLRFARTTKPARDIATSTPRRLI